MKKLLVILLAAAMLFCLAACTETLTPESSAPADTPASQPEETSPDVLPFINKDEIYFDIHLSEGLFDKTSIKVGDNVLTSSGKTAYTGNETITFEGTSEKDTTVYLVIISQKAGERATSDYSTPDASHLPEMIKQRIPIHKSGRDKILVIITDTKEYDHSFDSALSDLIKLALG